MKQWGFSGNFNGDWIDKWEIFDIIDNLLLLNEGRENMDVQY
jgi:hypothetical protein